MSKLVIYTALFGSYDNLFEPKEAYENCDFICFTDQKDIKSNIWKIIVVDSSLGSPTMKNRTYKILTHKYLDDYENSLYIDSNIIIKNNPYSIVMKYLDKCPFLMPKHILRNCLYQEAKVCVGIKKTPVLKTIKQLKRYNKEGFPVNFGLGENNILLRKHNDKQVIKLMETWYNELEKETQRDQLSLGYSLWINNQKFSYITENSRKLNNFFTFSPHQTNMHNSLFSKMLIPLEFRFRKLIYHLIYFVK